MALKADPRPAGFTLVELLAATALFAVLGTMIFQMVRGGMELWSRGEQVRDVEERAEAALDLIAEDLRHLWSGGLSAGNSGARLLLTREPLLSADQPQLDGRTSVLRFSRLAYEQRQLPWLRQAGRRPGAQQAVTFLGREDPDQLLPTGGLAESLYGCVAVAGEELPVLMRRLRSPLGGPGSLLGDDRRDLARLLSWDGVQLIDRVLAFTVRCWAPETLAWDAEQGPPGASASWAWDSTRGLLAADDPDFPYGKGPESLDDFRDDLFPPALRIELVLDPFVDSQLASARLAADLSAEADQLLLQGAPSGGGTDLPGFLWIDGEWLAVRRRSGERLLVKRGQRGTRAVAHKAGRGVRAGQLFERVVRLPGAREAFDR